MNVRARDGRAALVAVAAVAVVAGGFLLVGMQTRPSTNLPYRFNSKGDLIRPEGYREWVYVGTPLTPNELNRGNAPFPEFHSVYIDPDSFAYWKKTGEFRDGTILTKELISVGSKSASSGKGYFMGEFLGLEATVKSKQRFPDEPGNWAYFSFGHAHPLAKAATAFPSLDCNACHEDNASFDWVFLQYYPVLRAAQGGAAEHDRGGAATHDGATCAACRRTVERFGEVGGAAGVDLPMNKDDLFAFVKAGKHKSWARESEMRLTDAPHGTYVITYLNAILEASMKNGNDVHPVGSASVKEMFGDEKKPFGWAVSVKAKPDRDGGPGWYWDETLSTTDPYAIP